MLKTLNSSLSETSYQLSKNLKTKEDVTISRPILDRIAANQSFINAIVVVDGNKVLLSTDPHYRSEFICAEDSSSMSAYQALTKKKCKV